MLVMVKPIAFNFLVFKYYQYQYTSNHSSG